MNGGRNRSQSGEGDGRNCQPPHQRQARPLRWLYNLDRWRFLNLFDERAQPLIEILSPATLSGTPNFGRSSILCFLHGAESFPDSVRRAHGNRRLFQDFVVNDENGFVGTE
jgi:hypothetical protein